MSMAVIDLTDPAADDTMPHPSALIVGRFDQRSGYAVNRPRGAPSWLLLWTDGGAGYIGQGGSEVRTAPGDLVVLESGVAQAYRVADGSDGWRFWWAHFQPRQDWRTWLRPFHIGGGCHVVAGIDRAFHPRIDDTMHRMHADVRWPAGAVAPPDPFQGTGPAPVVVADRLRAHELALTSIEQILLLATTAAGSTRPGDERIRLAEALIAADPAAPHTVAALARRVGLSESRFAHLFTEQTGRSPMHTVQEARLLKAGQLLRMTDLAVGQVAAACGFESPFHFSRLFRRRHGLPPGRYRALPHVP